MKNLFFLLVLIGLSSCHSAKKVTTTTTTVTKVEPKAQDVPLPATAIIQITDSSYVPPDSTHKLADYNKVDTVVQLTESNYRFQVLFINAGAGIDNKAKRKYTGFIRDYEGQNKVKLPYDEITVGSAGESNFGFMLLELNAVQQAKFISDSKEFLKDYNLVRYSEHITPHAEPGKGPGLMGPP